MTFHSILFDKADVQKETAQQPDCFADLNLDQVIDSMTARKQEYNLKPFYYTPLRNSESIYYRHEVMRDLEDKTLMAYVKAFAEKMIIVRRYLGMVENLEYQYHKEGWLLEAVLLYCHAVTRLVGDLRETNLKSRGFLRLREYVVNYAQSQAFLSLQAEAQKVKDRLANVRYSVIVEYGKFSVRKYEEETDYSVEVEKTFEKFKQGAVKNYLLDLDKGSGMNHIQAKIFEFVALLYPEEFAALTRFCQRHSNFVDDTLRRIRP